VSERLTQIGKYIVECVIGEGAMGVVYRASDPLINRRVAIKVMADSLAKDPTLRERFLREAQAAGSLQHPNLVTIYDFGEIDDHLYIAMEYIEGDDLADLLRKRVPIPIDQALDLVIGLLQGLAFAHKRGIVHRDIKPANIRVDGEGHARLMDFGVAHLSTSEMTNTGVLLGTPSYMAPEQITGNPVSVETDIFSVGAVLYELIAGTRPFHGDTLQALMYQVLMKVPDSLDVVVPGLPSGLNLIVMRALEKEQSQRYRSALAMANDLAIIRDSLDPTGRRTATSLRATIDTALAGERMARHRKRQERHLVAILGGVAVAVALFAAGRFLSSRSASSSPPAVALGASSSAAGQVVRDSAPATGTSAAQTARTTTASGSISSSSVPQRAPTGTRQQRVSPPPASAGLRANDTRTVSASPTAPSQSIAAGVQPIVQVPNVPVQQPVATQQLAVAPPVVAQPAPAPAAVESRESAATQISAVIGAYARALESRDIDELRRVYPSMTDTQRRAFEDFFRSTRSLRATLSVGALQVDGSNADAQLSGVYNYITVAGIAQQQPVSFRASLRRDAGAWKLVAVR
jgi:serine/threonine-protein kinase